MPLLPVGTIVRIKSSSRYYQGKPNNPIDVNGRITDYDRSDTLCYEVVWDNGHSNHYGETDLITVEGFTVPGVTPTKAKKAKKKTPSLVTRISMARKVIAEKFKDHGSNGVAVHLRASITEPKYQDVLTGPCHGFIRNDGNKQSEAIITLIDRMAQHGDYGRSQKELGEESVVAYYDWLFNRSPYAYIFMYKNAKHCWKRKTAVLRTDVPANMLQGALICTRNSWEHIHRVRLFHTLAKSGVDENLAFLLSGFFQQDSTGEIRSSVVVSDHHVLGQAVTKQGARAFLSSSPLKETALYNNNGTYGGVKAAWEGRGEHIQDTLKDAFNSFSTKGAKVDRNPFRKAKASRQQNTKAMNKEEFVQFVATLSFD